MCSSSPDTSGLNAAAQTSANTSQEALDWFTNYVDSTQPQRDATTAIDNQVATAQLAGMQQAQQQAADLDTRNKTVFQPVEDKVVSDAMSYDTPERRNAAAGAAMSDVMQASAAQSAANNRALGRAGVAPGSAKSQAMNNDMALGTALGEQSAATKARQQVETTGHAEMMDAAGLGKGVVSNQATMMQTAMTGGAATTAASGAALTANTSAAPLMQTGYGQALQGSQIAGNLYGQGAAIEASQQAGMMAGVGGIMSGVGSIMGASSKTLKTDKRPADDKAALDAVNETPVGAWRYKPGVADEGDHVGPYAQDVRRTMGEAAAPGGQMVNLSIMQDVNKKAIRQIQTELAAVNAEIKQLEGARR